MDKESDTCHVLLTLQVLAGLSNNDVLVFLFLFIWLSLLLEYAVGNSQNCGTQLVRSQCSLSRTLARAMYPFEVQLGLSRASSLGLALQPALSPGVTLSCSTSSGGLTS